MPLRVFECACVVVVVFTLALMARRTPLRRLLGDYGALALAGYIGEETCVRFYRFYAYADGWDARIDEVPLLVPLIWPLVILSARGVADALLPGAGALRRALAVGALVIVDASLVEVVAVRAGLWSWAEGGHLGVPVLGIVGWGFFAFAADLARGVLDHAPRLLALAGVVVLAPVATHALILLAWWACFRWTLRGDLGAGSVVALGVLSIGATLGALVLRRRGRSMALDVATPRIAAALLFFTLLSLTAAPWDGATAAGLWIHTAAVAVPYLAATRFEASSSRAARA